MMNLNLNILLVDGYSSLSQKARRLTEGWVGANMYCPRCGHPSIDQCENNKPVSDFACPKCGNVFELKSKNGSLQSKVNDGAYETMVSRITSNTNPDFMFLGYNRNNMSVENLIVIPKHFFVPAIIEKRKPLALSARRTGWVGCNILLSGVPEQGRIAVIHNGVEIPRERVIEKLNRSNTLARGDIQSRGWLFDVLNCVNAIRNDTFTLSKMYDFVPLLSAAHPENRNVRAKIRQQLQTLRDAGYIEFLGRGKYRKLIHDALV